MLKNKCGEELKCGVDTPLFYIIICQNMSCPNYKKKKKKNLLQKKLPKQKKKKEKKRRKEFGKRKEEFRTSMKGKV